MTIHPTKLGTLNRIVIPPKLLRELGWTAGTELVVRLEIDGKVTLGRPTEQDRIDMALQEVDPELRTVIEKKLKRAGGR